MDFVVFLKKSMDGFHVFFCGEKHGWISMFFFVCRKEWMTTRDLQGPNLFVGTITET